MVDTLKCDRCGKSYLLMDKKPLINDIRAVSYITLYATDGECMTTHWLCDECVKKLDKFLRCEDINGIKKFKLKVRYMLRKSINNAYGFGNVVEHIERDTVCDKCEYLQTCILSGNLLDCTTNLDARKHYIRGINCNCTRDNELTIEQLRILAK